MDIIWYGHSFFEIKDKANGKKLTLAIDPFNESIGLKPKKIRADILLLSHYHHDHSNKKIVEGKPFLIDTPGEYEVKGVKIRGIPSFHDKLKGEKRGKNTIFKIELGRIKICHLGDFGENEISPEKLEDIFGIDILLIPIGGNLTISGKEAAGIVKQIEPRITIPMHYKIKGLDLNLNDEKEFLKSMGIKEKTKIKKLKIRKSDLAKEGTEVILLLPV